MTRRRALRIGRTAIGSNDALSAKHPIGFTSLGYGTLTDTPTWRNLCPSAYRASTRPCNTLRLRDPKLKDREAAISVNPCDEFAEPAPSAATWCCRDAAEARRRPSSPSATSDRRAKRIPSGLDRSTPIPAPAPPTKPLSHKRRAG